MPGHNDYTTKNCLDLFYYKLIGIDLSRQKGVSILQQINFAGKLEERDGTKMFCFFFAEK